MFIQKKIITFVLFLFSVSLFSQVSINEKKIFLGEIQPIHSEKNLKIESALIEKIKFNLEQNKFKVLLATDSTLSSRINSTKENGGLLLVEGFYQSGNENKNLSIYIQIYNPENGFMIDANSVVDENQIIEGVELDPKELKEADYQKNYESNFN